MNAQKLAEILRAAFGVWLDGSSGIVVETVGQVSSLRGQDARPTVNFVFLITSNPGEPISFYGNG
jgi:hypothetical protein